MEFNGINNETNGIDGFERRLSERASAIDELMELVKSIGGRWERERRLIRRQQSIHSAIYWWMSWCGGGEENQSSGAPSSAHRCAASQAINNQLSLHSSTQKEVLMRWMKKVCWLGGESWAPLNLFNCWVMSRRLLYRGRPPLQEFHNSFRFFALACSFIF